MPIKNFDSYLKEPNGDPYMEMKPTGDFLQSGAPIFVIEEGKVVKEPVKFSLIIGNLLKNGLKDEKLSSHEVIENWNLMKNLATGGDIELTGKQITYIEKLVLASSMQKFIVGQICEYLNDPEKKDNV